MATDAPNKQEFLVRNLPTRSVTLYPAKAQVIRDIIGISLKPGPNQVIIEGLAPTVDEHSIKVEGTGAATITDMTVTLTANREVYEDIYPSDDDEDEEDEEEPESDQEDKATKEVSAEIAKLNVELAAAREKVQAADARFAMLDKYTGTMASERPDDLEKCFQTYANERAKAYADHTEFNAKATELAQKITGLIKQKTQLGKAAAKAKEKARIEKIKKETKARRQQVEKSEEKARIKAERAKFWPKKVYKVIVSIDAPSGETPVSSRRGSIDSLVKVPLPVEPGSSSNISNLAEINLSVSYITYSASWSPRYDLSLNSVSNSGILDYCAELKNETSETWRETKIIISTSQTSYQGLGDVIPTLQPWHVRLIKNGFGGRNSSLASKAPALYSHYEQEQKAKSRKEIPAQVFAPRQDLFGLEQSYDQHIRPYAPPQGALLRSQQQQQQQQPQQYLLQNAELMAGAPYAASSQPPPLARHACKIFGSHSRSDTQPHSSLFGNAVPAASALAHPFAPQTPSNGATFGSTNQVASSTLFGSSSRENKANNSLSDRRAVGSVSDYSAGVQPSAPAPERDGIQRSGAIDQVGDDMDDEATISTPDPAMLFEESSFSDSGLTTTYDVPTLKTLAPASSTIKHKIARIEFKSVVFSHILIPKLKASAFLKARLRNASKISLLKGPAGLTLDGSFMGQSSIPRCSAGDSFTLSLGVDPTISVSYAQPTVRRSQSGIFSKEDCEVYTRQATITNTKHDRAVELQVLDQVPVSEDERLHIEIVSPKGLRISGDAVPAGAAISQGNGVDSVSSAARSRTSIYSDGSKASGSGHETGKWGSATAVAKKDGEVNWTVKINPLRGCKLLLEYEATYPGGEQVSGIN